MQTDEPKKDQKSTLKSLDRSLDILSVLAESPHPLSVQDLSKLLNVNRTTLYAALNSLYEKNFIEKVEPDAKYTIGYRMYELGTCYKKRFTFTAAAEMYAKLINEKYHALVNVGVYKPLDSVLILISQYPVTIGNSNTINLMPIASFCTPIHCSALGKILLSGLDDNELNTLLDQIEFKHYTPRTLTTKKELLTAIEVIRSSGYATDEAEYMDYMYCIAAPIRDYTGKIIAAFSMSNMSEQFFKENYKKLSLELISICKQISITIGWKP